MIQDHSSPQFELYSIEATVPAALETNEFLIDLLSIAATIAPAVILIVVLLRGLRRAVRWMQRARWRAR